MPDNFQIKSTPGYCYLRVHYARFHLDFHSLPVTRLYGNAYDCSPDDAYTCSLSCFTEPALSLLLLCVHVLSLLMQISHAYGVCSRLCSSRVQLRNGFPVSSPKPLPPLRLSLCGTGYSTLSFIAFLIWLIVPRTYFFNNCFYGIFVSNFYFASKIFMNSSPVMVSFS